MRERSTQGRTRSRTRGPVECEFSDTPSRPRPSLPRLRTTGELIVRVLLIEDHWPLVRALRQGLEEEGFAVDVAYDGEEGGYKAETAEYDVIILDLMLPKEDGLSLLQRWRRAGLQTHVLVLTAKGSIED